MAKGLLCDWRPPMETTFPLRQSKKKPIPKSRSSFGQKKEFLAKTVFWPRVWLWCY